MVERGDELGVCVYTFSLSLPQSGPCQSAEPSPAEWSSEYQSHCPSLEEEEEGEEKRRRRRRERERNNSRDHHMVHWTSRA